MTKKKIFIWTCDYSKNSGEGKLARLFVKNFNKKKKFIIKFNQKKILNQKYISTFLKNCGSHECDNFGSTIANAINFLMLYPPDKGIEINESANANSQNNAVQTSKTCVAEQPHRCSTT